MAETERIDGYGQHAERRFSGHAVIRDQVGGSHGEADRIEALATDLKRLSDSYKAWLFEHAWELATHLNVDTKELVGRMNANSASVKQVVEGLQKVAETKRGTDG